MLYEQGIARKSDAALEESTKMYDKGRINKHENKRGGWEKRTMYSIELS